MNKEFLFELLKTGSVSGNEAEVEKKIYDYMLDKVDCVSVDELGNVTAAVNTDAKFKVLAAGHADEIGLMVSAIGNDGMLMVTKIGGIYPTTYPGHKVRVYTENGVIVGAVANSREISENKELKASAMRIDIGALNREDAQKYVKLGDTVTFDTDVRELLNDRISGRGLDNRLGAFIVMEAIAKAKKTGAEVGCYSVATVGEETTGNGAYFAASRVQPNVVIAVDVTYTSDNCGISEAITGDISVGGGAVICNNPSIHKKLNEHLRLCAKRLGISLQTEAANGYTGTDGDTMHKTGIGVPFALISIPLRYMHNPAEVCSLKDVEDCINLLAEFFVSCAQDMNLKPF
jgi:endoglucanase